MTVEEARKLLIEYNQWRRSAESQEKANAICRKPSDSRQGRNEKRENSYGQFNNRLYAGVTDNHHAHGARTLVGQP